MTPEETREQLAAAETATPAALTAAVEHAAALAPDIIDLLNQAADGVFLLPRQRNLLFNGLHALAAGRVTAALPPLLALMRQPEEQLDRLFGENGITERLTRLLLSLYDGNPDPLFAALEDPAVEGFQKWSLFQALARLVWEDRVDRNRFVAALDRFDREEMAPKGDLAWVGWEDAVAYLGLIEFEERTRLGWEAERLPYQNEADRRDFLTRLYDAVANPNDPGVFDDHVKPIDDPVEAVNAFRSWWDEEGDENSPGAARDADPAADIALSEQEIGWLWDFLASEKVPDSTMPLEQLDGFFAALAVAPERVPTVEYMRVVWATEDGAGAVFDNPEQREFFDALLARHMSSIARRIDAGYPHIPLLEDPRGAAAGNAWGYGFMVGIGLRTAAWQPFLRSGKLAPMLILLRDLADEYGYESPDDEPLEPEDSAELVEMLCALPLVVHQFWRERAAGIREEEPLRSTKVGRNAPCLCGSGRKYKRCCGAAA